MFSNAYVQHYRDNLEHMFMDSRDFDALTRVLSAAGARRRFLGLLAMTPLAATLAGEASLDQADAKKKKKKKRKKTPAVAQCTPESAAQTCANRCGAVQNNCQQPVDCGSCDCPAPCPACFVCQPGAGKRGACVVDPARRGAACGATGLVCQENGDCACNTSPDTCTAPATCGGGGQARKCGCTPLTACPVGLDCGDIEDGCGGTVTCGSCTREGDICGNTQVNVCGCTPTGCSATRECGTVSDFCGGTVDCGTCPNDEICSGHQCWEPGCPATCKLCPLCLTLADEVIVCGMDSDSYAAQPCNSNADCTHTTGFTYCVNRWSTPSGSSGSLANPIGVIAKGSCSRINRCYPS